MGRYSNLTDEELSAKITSFRDAIEAIALGGDVSVVAGEGRRMEFTRSNVKDAERIMQQLEAEWDARFPATPQTYGRALGVRWVR